MRTILRKTLLHAGPFLATLCLLFTFQIISAQKFVIPVLPDTQNEISGQPEMFTSQMNWIANNHTKLNIPIVLHVGDIINWQTPDQIMWKTASKGFKILDSVHVPYALTLGNHDGAAVKVGGSAAPGDVHANLRDTRQFNEFFPVSRFTAQKGRYDDTKSDNAWYTFNAGGLKWMVLTLEFCARQGPVDWANKVLSANPDKNAIILTHFHLTSKGEINQNNAGYGDLSCQAIYDQMIKIHPNVCMVLSGHTDSTAWRDDVGTNGNHIYQMLQDYQGMNKGGGFIRLIEVDTKKGTISASMYSPFTNQTKTDFSQFSFSNVKFVRGKK